MQTNQINHWLMSNYQRTLIMKNVLTQLAKSVLKLLGLIAVASVADAETHKKILGSRASGSETTAQIILSKEVEHITKIVIFLKYSSLIMKSITQTIESEMTE